MWASCWVACLLLTAQTSFAGQLISERWQQFQDKYPKVYRNSVEETMRFKIFKENLQCIDQHNKEYEEGKHTYTVAVNQFADMLHSEYVEQMLMDFEGNETDADEGVYPIIIIDDPKESGKELPQTDADEGVYPIIIIDDPKESGKELPQTVDWRTKGAVTPVKDQGQCGSCWAFSATGSMEGQTYLKKKKLVSLSEQNLVDCSTENYGCDGGLHYKAMDYVQRNGGIDTEQSYPYEARDGPCRYHSNSIGTKINGRKMTSKNSEDSLKQAVANIGPISVSIDAGSSAFQFYSGGVLIDSQCSSSYTNHAVLAVGYGTENGQDYWLVKNSWGLWWGDQGYIKMARNHHNMCAIASSCAYPVI